MNVSNQQLESMLRAIPDTRLRSELSNIVNGTIVKEIYCQSKVCKNRLIGYIYEDGRVQMVTDEDGKSYLRSSRHRLDGFMGFECWCGNDSRLSLQEQGHIGQGAPSKSELEKVWNNLSNKPSKYPIIKGQQKIDGFLVKEIN